MTREQAMEWVIPALKHTWNEKNVKRILKALEQEPSEDCISRQAVYDLLATWLSDYLTIETREALETIVYKIEDIPSVTSQPKTGHWIRQDNTKEPLYGWYFCSECNSVIGDKTKFCSNCGARMESEDKE